MGLGTCAHSGVGHLKLPFVRGPQREGAEAFGPVQTPGKGPRAEPTHWGRIKTPEALRESPARLFCDSSLYAPVHPVADRLECVWRFFNRTFRKTLARRSDWAPAWAFASM